jgi:hypothetical protein
MHLVGTNKKQKLSVHVSRFVKRTELTKLVGTFVQVLFPSVPPKPQAVFYLISYYIL